MFSHVTIGTRNFPAAFAFYAALMKPLGWVLKFAEPEREWAAWRKPGTARPLFIIGRPFNGNPASAGNGQMVAFIASGHDTVDRCHALALQSGGTDMGAPGFRPEYHPHYYGGYFLDPDSNKICVCCHDAAGAYRIQQDDLTGQASRALVALHRAGMHENSPPEHVFALDTAGLLGPGIRFFTAWDGERISGMVALKSLHGGIGELKSMRTHPDYLRKGVARRLLAHVLAEAVAQDMTRLSLETGKGTAFEPALALYRQHGFANGEQFGDYAASAFNQFLHLDL
jgi:putative acetyltransferase